MALVAADRGPAVPERRAELRAAILQGRVASVQELLALEPGWDLTEEFYGKTWLQRADDAPESDGKRAVQEFLYSKVGPLSPLRAFPIPTPDSEGPHSSPPAFGTPRLGRVGGRSRAPPPPRKPPASRIAGSDLPLPHLPSLLFRDPHPCAAPTTCADCRWGRSWRLWWSPAIRGNG